jgi:hypothetical protein
MGSVKRAQLRQAARFPSRQAQREQDDAELYPLGMLEQINDGKHQKVCGIPTGYIEGGMKKSAASANRQSRATTSRRDARINTANIKMRKAFRND